MMEIGKCTNYTVAHAGCPRLTRGRLPAYSIGREQTPKMLELEDGDQIDVQIAQVGGYSDVRR